MPLFYQSTIHWLFVLPKMFVLGASSGRRGLSVSGDGKSASIVGRLERISSTCWFDLEVLNQYS
jgi:hypothetical protein